MTKRASLMGSFLGASVAIAWTVLILPGQQGQGNPFLDHADNGETIHVLPAPAALRSPRDTQLSFAPVKNGTALYPASYGSGPLTYHGGNVMPNATYIAVYWNSTVSSAPGTVNTTIAEQIASFASTFWTPTWSGGPADDFSIVQQYTQADGRKAGETFGFGFSYIDNKPKQNNLKDADIRNYLIGLFNGSGAGGKLAVSNTYLYGVYLPSGTRVQLQGGTSCSSFCGYHSKFNYNGTSIKYAVYPYPDCSGCRIAGLGIADSLTVTSSHEIREAVTDPGDDGIWAWYDSAGSEGDDKCAWHNLYRTTSGGHWVQPEYSNAVVPNTNPPIGSGCVVPNR